MLELLEASYRYPGADEDVLHGVSLAVAPGECVCLVGANGSGKSTAARLACAAIRPSWGRLLVDGEEFSDPGCGGLVAVVGQDPREQMTSMLVEEEVAFGPRCQLLSEQEVDTRVRDALSVCGIAHLIDRATAKLSGGQMQLVALAGALAVRPRYLVLDEATSHLDGKAREQIYDVIDGLLEKGMGVLMVTHDVREARKADRVLEMFDGAIEWEGAPRDWEERRARRLSSPEAQRDAVLGDLGFASADEATSLSLRDVCVSYGDTPVLDGLNVSAAPGELVLLCGRPGSGKTTAARVLTGVLRPDTGQALLGEREVRAGEVGLAFQRPEEQLFESTVFDDVAYGPRNKGLDEDEVARRVTESLEAFGLPERYWHVHAQTLSGGMRRRVALASIVAPGPAAYVLDEPTAGLDDEGHRLLHEMVARLREGGSPVYLVTHDPDQWQAEATRRIDIEAMSAESDSTAHAGGKRRRRRLTLRLPHHDPRFLVLSLLALMVGLFACTSTAAMACALACSIALLILTNAGAGRIARSLMPAIPVLSAVLLANAVRIDGSGDVAFAGAVGVSTAGLALGALAVMRILTLIFLVVSLVAQVTTTDLGRLVRTLLSPLARLGVNTTGASMVLSVTLSMIPQAFDEFQRIAEAQQARGARLYSDSIVKRIRSLLAVVAPLVVVLISCSEALAHAMSLRGFRGEMTMPRQRPQAADWLLLLVSIVAAVLLAWM